MKKRRFLSSVSPPGRAKRARFVNAPGAQPVEEVPSDPIQTQNLHMLLSALLDYPRDNFEDALDAADEVAQMMPPVVAADLEQFVAWARDVGKQDVEKHYVETFDQRRRCTMYLSYYLAGDTRVRGGAILGFRTLRQAVGYDLEKDELDDYLPLLLELSGQSGDPMVWDLFAAHRSGIEVMRAALHASHSPYKHLMDAFTRTLPEITDEEEEKFVELVSAGPPTELVGLQNDIFTRSES